MPTYPITPEILAKAKAQIAAEYPHIPAEDQRIRRLAANLAYPMQADARRAPVGNADARSMTGVDALLARLAA